MFTFIGLHGDVRNAGLRIKSWNINGFKSKDLGNKLLQRDFLDETSNYDIVVLTETHAYGHDLSLPGFCLYLRRERKISKKCKKSFGGIAIFIKECLQLKKPSVKLIMITQTCVGLKSKRIF